MTRRESQIERIRSLPNAGPVRTNPPEPKSGAVVPDHVTSPRPHTGRCSRARELEKPLVSSAFLQFSNRNVPDDETLGSERPLGRNRLQRIALERLRSGISNGSGIDCQRSAPQEMEKTSKRRFGTVGSLRPSPIPPGTNARLAARAVVRRPTYGRSA